MFTTSDANPLSWQETELLVDGLADQVKSYFEQRGEQLPVIAPLLRTGGIVGGWLAIKMQAVTMLPVQFKYSYHPTEIHQIISVPALLTDIPKPLNILLCEGNTSSGSIAVKAAAVIKETYPTATVFLATLTKVYGGPESLTGIEHIFIGQTTDENFKASEEQRKNLNLRSGITIFPWESVEDELSDINAM